MKNQLQHISHIKKIRTFFSAIIQLLFNLYYLNDKDKIILFISIIWNYVIIIIIKGGFNSCQVLFFFIMPLISISMYPGRTKEQKEEFARAITDAAVQILKTKAEHVIIVYDEKSRENWFVSGKPL